jgi:hypothetical protein
VLDIWCSGGGEGDWGWGWAYSAQSNGSADMVAACDYCCALLGWKRLRLHGGESSNVGCRGAAAAKCHRQTGFMAGLLSQGSARLAVDFMHDTEVSGANKG